MNKWIGNDKICYLMVKNFHVSIKSLDNKFVGLVYLLVNSKNELIFQKEGTDKELLKVELVNYLQKDKSYNVEKDKFM